MTMLEVVAGTCAISRSFAPYIRIVVCLDATESMLAIKKSKSIRSDLDKMVFIRGFAKELPFL